MSSTHVALFNVYSTPRCEVSYFKDGESWPETPHKGRVFTLELKRVQCLIFLLGALL